MEKSALPQTILQEPKFNHEINTDLTRRYNVIANPNRSEPEIHLWNTMHIFGSDNGNS